MMKVNCGFCHKEREHRNSRYYQLLRSTFGENEYRLEAAFYVCSMCRIMPDVEQQLEDYEQDDDYKLKAV